MGDTTMADDLRVGLSELLRKAKMEHDADFLREDVRVLSEEYLRGSVA
jgi:hypothetical protein